MAEILIYGEATTIDVSMLDYNRFTEKRLIPEYNVVWLSFPDCTPTNFAVN